MNDLVTRFAPSPTGYLHLGHVVNAIYVWGAARACGARVLLRIEDHDRIRSRPEYEAALLEDLDWLGFTADAGRDPLTRQSDRDAIYRQALDRLARTLRVYACDCSRAAIRRRAGSTGDVSGDRYDGHCRTRGLADGPGRTLRVELDAGSETFTDWRLGTITQSPAEQCGDLAIRDRDGHWTYQFAVTVDDADQRVTLVIRGEDLLSSTGRQIRLARMLGQTPPAAYLHHPLILGASGEKLSKSAGDTGVRELRASGAAPADVIGLAAAAAGLIAEPRPLGPTEVTQLFRQGSWWRRTYSP